GDLRCCMALAKGMISPERGGPDEQISEGAMNNRENQSRAADSMVTSATLLIRIKADSPARELAWSELHARYAPIISGFARKLGAPKSEVEDIVQEVLTGFYSALPKFNYDPHKGRFRGFLKVCTIHAIIKRMGKRAKWKNVPLEQVDPDSLSV